MLQIPTPQLAKILSSSGSLNKKGLLEDPEDQSVQDIFGTPSVDETIMGILQEPDIAIETVIGRILGEKRVARRKWADFDGMGEQAEQLRRFVKGRIKKGTGASILLVSDVGIGKSTMIEALCADLGIDLYVPGDDDAFSHDGSGRPIPAAIARFDAWTQGQALLAARYRNGDSKSVVSALFMDEIGDLVAREGNGRQTDGSYGGGAVSRLHTHNALEFPGVITFFAGNNQTKWDPAFLSRMKLVLHLRTPNRAYREKIWQVQVIEQNMGKTFTPDEIAKMAERFELPPRIIENAVEYAKSTEGTTDDALFYLKSMCEVLYGGLENVEVGNPLRQPFYPALVVPQGITMADVDKQMAAAATKPLRMHIAGPDGTGKRLLAEYFGDKAKRQLRSIGISDIMGQGIDDTRANIRTVFREAAEDGLALHITGIDKIITAQGTTENPVLEAACKALGDNLRQSKVPVIMTTRFEHLNQVAPDVLTAFSSTVKLDYLDEIAIKAAVNLFGGGDIAVHTTQKEITPADVADAVSQMKMLDLPASDLGAAIDNLSKARRGTPTHRMGF